MPLSKVFLSEDEDDAELRTFQRPANDLDNAEGDAFDEAEEYADDFGMHPYDMHGPFDDDLEDEDDEEETASEETPFTVLPKSKKTNTLPQPVAPTKTRAEIDSANAAVTAARNARIHDDAMERANRTLDANLQSEEDADEQL